MSFSADEIEALARLGRLSLSDDERAELAEQLVRIVGYVEQLQEVDTDGVEPMTHAIPMNQRRRADAATFEVAGRDALRGSAGYADGRVRVPRVVE